MKILIAGGWTYLHYEQAFAAALSELGHEVIPFRTAEFFEGILGKEQHAVPVPGPALLRLNRALVRRVKETTPNVMLAWRCTHLLPSTIRTLNSLGIITASFNNDDPFGPSVHGNVPWHHHALWFWYLRSLKDFRRNFFYRQINVDEATARGAKGGAVLKPYFLPWRDRPMELSEAERARFGCDVVFVGHFEGDERVKHLRALVDSGLSVKVFGGAYWSREALGELYSKLAPITPALGDDYAKALCGAKVCLAFLSKLNRDTYTRRCFEIPACGRVMLAEHTDDLVELFKPDQEACFFSTTEELVAKARWLVENPAKAEEIAQAGLERVWADGHDVKSRAASMLARL
jgi:hypothetical protein